MNYGDYSVSYPKSYEVAQNKQEKAKKNKSSVLETVAKVTVGAVAIGATLLLGYGIINKGQGKKAAEKAKEGVKEVANKGVNKVKDNVKKDQTQTIQKLLGNLKEGEFYSIEDAKQLKEALTIYKANLPLLKDIDTTGLTENINKLIGYLKEYIDTKSEQSLGSSSDLITAKADVTTSLTTLQNIIQQSSTNEQELEEIRKKTQNIELEVEVVESPVVAPNTIKFEEKNTLQDFSADEISVQNVSVVKDEAQNAFYLVLDAADLKGFDIITTPKETFKYTFNETDGEKDCYLFKLEPNLALDKMIKLIKNKDIKDALIANDNESKYLQTYFKNKAKEVSKEDKLHDNEDLSNLIHEFDADSLEEGLANNIAMAKTSLAINKLKYDRHDNLFSNFNVIPESYVFESNKTSYLNKSGSWVEAEEEYLLKIDVDDARTVEITDEERGLTYKDGKLTVEYNPLQHCIDLLNIGNIQNEEIISSMQTQAMNSLKELLSKTNTSSLNLNAKKVLEKLKTVKTPKEIQSIIYKNPKGFRDIKQACSLKKTFESQKEFNDFMKKKSSRTDSTIPLKNHLLQMFNQPCLVFRKLTGFNGVLSEEYDVKQTDENTTTYISEETPPKTYNVEYSSSDNKVTVELQDGTLSTTFAYNINDNKYDGAEPTVDEKAKIDLFVFNALSKDEKISFVKAQLHDIIDSLTKTSIDKQQTELKLLITYLADNDPNYKKDAAGKDNYENSISNMWNLMLEDKGTRGKKATLFTHATEQDNKFYINSDGSLNQNEPLNGSYILVSINTISGKIKFELTKAKK